MNDSPRQNRKDSPFGIPNQSSEKQKLGACPQGLQRVPRSQGRCRTC